MLKYRVADGPDFRFVLESWLDSYKLAHAAGLVAVEEWNAVMRPQLQRILSRPGCRTYVAYNPAETESGSDLYGWAAVERGFQVPVRNRINGLWQTSLETSEDPLIHYVFTKQAYRKLGIAKGLLKAAGVNLGEPFFYSCKTPVVSRLEQNLAQGKWNPLLARFPKS